MFKDVVFVVYDRNLTMGSQSQHIIRRERLSLLFDCPVHYFFHTRNAVVQYPVRERLSFADVSVEIIVELIIPFLQTQQGTIARLYTSTRPANEACRKTSYKQ